MLLSRARAALAGRDYVIPEDVKQVAVPALAHRLTLRPEVWLRRVEPGTVITEVLEQVPAPASGILPTYASQPRPRGEGADAARHARG
jgi:MoxR-like ATPase